MRRTLCLIAASLALFNAPAALAALVVGAPAPGVTADAAVAGQPFKFSLAETLKMGPVVLYFYPKAFTSGCTVEAHNFAEATDKFKAKVAAVFASLNPDGHVDAMLKAVELLGVKR
ncbi:hypothetical protein BH11PSE10_BH11PSE10_20520 [soil metagenome]